MVHKARKWLAMAVAVFGVGACEEVPVSLPEPTSVAASTAALRLTVGDVVVLSNQVLDRDGRPIPGLQASFSSDNPSVALVDAAGNVRAVSPGTTGVSTSYGSITATTPVTVARDERGLVRTLEVLADSVVTDVHAGAQPVFFRAFNGFGQAVCPPAAIRVSNRNVVEVSQAECRLNVTPTFAGRATVTVSVDSVSATFAVVVSSTGATAFVSARPPEIQLFAGNTVTYGVRVLDEARNPAANAVVDLDVTAGRLAATRVTTDGSGVALVQYTLPTNLRAFGSWQEISFRARLANGATAAGVERVPVIAAPTRIRLYRYSNRPGGRDPFLGIPLPVTITEITGDTIRISLRDLGAHLGASAEDSYGNSAMGFVWKGTGAAQSLCGGYIPAIAPATVSTCIAVRETGSGTVTVTTGASSRTLVVVVDP